MTDLKEKTIGEIVTYDYRTAFVFKSYGIDYCCGGKRSIQKACTTKNINPDLLEKEVRAVLSEPDEGPRFSNWPAGFLSDYIVNNHHSYVRNKLPELLFLAVKVAKVHGGSQPELKEMLTLVKELNTELRAHLSKEEEELFPAVKAFESGSEAKISADDLLYELELEHETAGELMKKLAILSNDFTPPEGACTSYTIYFKTLREFQDDLHKHVHLENNLLFPKVMQMLSAEG